VAVPKRAAAKKVAVKQAPAERAAAPQAPARKARTPRDPAAVLAPRKKAPPKLRLAAEETFDDDGWQQNTEPEPVREDPQARIRAVLRAAAQSLETKETGRPVVPSTAPPPPPAPRPADQPVTRVLVAPATPDVYPEVDDDVLEDDVLDEDELDADELVEGDEVVEDEGSPPEVLDDTAPQVQAPPPPPSPPAPPPSYPASTQDIVPPSFAPPEPAPAPAKEKKPGRRRGRSILVLALVAVLVAAGVLGFLALREEGVDYSKLKVGDCFDSSTSNEVRGIEVEPCSESHNSEIFFLVDHPAGPEDPYPGKDALVQFAADACLGQPLTEYLGIPLEQSTFKDFEIVPQESAWKDGRRVLVCGIDTGGEGDITGSVKGTRR